MHAVIVYYMLYRFDAFALFHDLEFPVWKVDVMTDVALIECLEMRFIPVIKFAQNIQYYIRTLPNWPMQSEAVLAIVWREFEKSLVFEGFPQELTLPTIYNDPRISLPAVHRIPQNEQTRTFKPIQGFHLDVKVPATENLM